MSTIRGEKALNPNPNGQWVDFKIDYKGNTKEFTVTYGTQTWTTKIDKTSRSMSNESKNALNAKGATYALSFVGSTGSGTNLQRVQIEKFEFTAPQIVHVKYVDTKGNEIEAKSAIPGDENQVVNLNDVNSLQKTINALKAKGYTLKDVNKDGAETYNATDNTVKLIKGEQLLKYVFAVPSPEVTKTLPSDNGMLPNGAIKSTDRTLSGTGTPGATINIKVAGNTVVDNVTVESNGKWTATLPTGLNSNVTTQDQLVPKNSLVVTQKIGPSESEEAEVDVALGESSVVPSTESKDQQSIVAETTTVTLKVPHDAGITYFDYPKAGNARSEVAIKRDSIPGAWTSKDESKAVVKSYSSDGFVDTIMLEMKEQIQAGKAKVISNIKENKYSSPTGWKEINVEAKPDTTPPTAPNVNTVKAGATSITGTAEANSTVEAILPNGRKVTATAGTDGSFTIPVSGLNEGDTISVTATDAANNKSTPSVVTVKENVRPVVNIPYDDKGNQIIYVYSGEENNIELKITDNSGKISKAYLVFAQDNRTGLGTEDTGYLNGKTKSALYLKANRFGSETTATEANPAIIKLTANIPNGSYTDGTGMTRYIYAEDLAGNTNYDNAGAAGDTGAPGRIRFVWKPQTFKYNAQAPSTPITSNTVPEASAIEKAVKDANPTFSDKIGSVTLDGTNVKVTYKDGSTDVIPANSVFTIEPTAPTVTPVKNPSSLEQPEKDAVKKAVETANPSATKVEVGTDGTTTLTYSNGSTAKLTPAQTVSQADVTPPVAPTVNAVKAGATSITGTAEEGSTVEVTLPNGQKASAKAGDNGEFSITVPALNADDQISVKATDAANNTSTPIKVTVKETVRPVLNIPYDDAANQAIYVYSGETNNIELKVTDNSGKIVKAYLVMPNLSRTGLGKEDNINLNGKKRAGLYLNAEKIKTETTATEASPAVIRVTGDIPKNTYKVGDSITRYLFAEDAAGNTSYEHVGANNDVGAPGRIRFVLKPQSFKYNPVAPSTPITSNTVPEASVLEKAVKDANPTFSDKIGSVTLDGTNVKVTYKDGSTDVIPANSVFTIEPTAPKLTPVKNPSSLEQPEKDAVKKAVATANPSATKVEVGTDGTTTLTYGNGSTAKLTPAQTVSQADVTAPDTPSVNPVKAGDTAITGKAEAGSTVEVTLPGGAKKSATAGEDGTFSIPVSGLNENDEISVTATDASNNTSAPTTATVGKAADKTAPEAPSVNPVKAGDEAITGKAEPGSTVEVTLPGGAKKSATAGEDGTFSVPVSGLNEGDKVSVTATDAAGNKSGATDATVAKADDTTAPTAPVVNPVKAGDTAVTGTAEAGSTVEVTLPDGTKVSAKADKDGNYSVPVNGLNAGDTVSVTATDESGNTSATTTVTVSNVNVGGKEADNAKVPALTPVVDPNNLTDAEKAKVAEEVKKANPTATDVKVNNDGSVVVTFADGSVATIAANKVVKEATKESSAQAPAKKAGAKELPNTGTKQSNASLGLALLAAVTGGLLVSKKRKEEE